jgi:hypothetical protein
MGYLNKTTQTVTAHFTKRGREHLANALSGDTSRKYVITQFALGDDEIDYGLWESTEPTNQRGRVIENMPLLESFLNQKEIMNSFIIDQPPIPQGNKISNVQPVIELTGRGETIEIIPRTENHNDAEQYEFFLEYDNIVEMSNPYTTPEANFIMKILDTSHLLPTASFTMSTGIRPRANFTMALA